jgi:pSer/pThr/pTyr-binding forkhead associated (FHA) protein
MDSRTITVHLIDEADGRTLQHWTFNRSNVIIGRDEAAQIPLADPYVSRVHVELIREDRGWVLVSRGRNGVLVQGRPVDSCPATPGLVFRLGAIGPMFRIDAEVSSTGAQTLSIDPSTMIVLALNNELMVRQADEIAETDYFRQLQAKARTFRQQRKPN